MAYYKIAGLNVSYCAKYEHTAERSRKYEVGSPNEVDIAVCVSDNEIEDLLKRAPNLTPGEAEYLLLGSAFYLRLLDFDGFFLHASAVMYEGEAYLFSAPCGTGKSTHTKLWQTYFGADKALIINDDKPALRLVGGNILVCGTPFSGKTNQNLSISAPLKSICFLEQSDENWIKPMPSSKAIAAILNQTIRPRELETMDKLLLNIEKVLESIQIYKMGCNISTEAVKLSYNAMKFGFEEQ